MATKKIPGFIHKFIVEDTYLKISHLMTGTDDDDDDNSGL
jgi:hypothetical protein